MKKLYTIVILILNVCWVGIFAQSGGQVTQVLRPMYIDTLSMNSQGAVLITMTGYPGDLVKYRLYNGSSQYYCWSSTSQSFVSSTAYNNGPLALGTPTSSSTFWIIYERGSNNSPIATYRDRIEPYTTNYNTFSLPISTTIKFPYELTGSLTGTVGYSLTDKYVILAYSGNNLINASSSDLTTGNFKITAPSDIDINRIEIRAITNEKITEKTGHWNDAGYIGEILLHHNSVTGIKEYRKNELFIAPIPAKDDLRIKGLYDIKTIEIIDLTGKTLKQVQVDQEEITISIKELKNGIYLLRAGKRVEMFIKN